MHRLAILLLMGLVLAACGGNSTTATTTTAASAPSTTAAAPTTEAPTTTETPTTTSPPREATLAIAGPEELVFDWSTDRCANDDIPDLPARAFRDADNQVQLISTHPRNLRFVGATLDDVERRCEVVYASAYDPDPSSHTDYEWLAATYTADGSTIHALVHNEYHGWERGGCTATPAFNCWYNAITLVVSNDGGSTYRPAAEPPNHLVAGLPYPYAEADGAVGMFSPSNIVTGPDDHFYALAKVGAYPSGAQTVCLMRTPDIGDPDAWRFWTGTAFDGNFADPYTDEVTEPSGHLCPALAIDEIGAQMIESLTWNTYLERWVLIGISADHIDGREVWGFYYSFSDDLIEWTRRKLLVEIELPWTVADSGRDVSYLYPSLLDPDSESRNFETTDDTAYLYYTRHNAGHASLDRDLVRVPVVFTLEP